MMIALDNKMMARNRHAFTLVELLTVVAIIAVLVSLVASATFQVIGVQQQRTTEATITKIADAVDQQMKAIVDQARIEPLGKYPFLAGLAGPNTRRQRVILVKLMLKQQMPMTFAEANAPVPMTGDPSYAAALSGWTPPVDNPSTIARNIEQQSGACLYMMLKQVRRGMNFNIDSALSSSEVGTVTIMGANGVPKDFPAIMDAWGHPLAFYRWPALNKELNPGAPGSGTPALTATSASFADAQDPEGTLADPSWATATNNGFLQFTQQFCHPLPPTTPPQAFVLTPVVASFGAAFGVKKKTSGIKDQFMQPDPTGNDNGNIYSYRLRPGARGD
jgi:prepilin-type N-terminal cleavage/methylation domain-containing protein